MKRLILLYLAFVPTLAFAVAFSGVTVPGTTNIFTDGGNANPATCCSSNGSSTGAVLAATFGAGPDQVLSVASATGTVGCAGTLANGADGPCIGGGTQVTGLGTISGIQATTGNMFLVGVFLDNGLPAAAPTALNYDGATLSFTQASYAPQVGQVFFIGDGLTGTGSGVPQVFSVPPTATRLYLGFADAYAFVGPPDYYADNPGSLTVSGIVQGPAMPVPIPVSFVLILIIGLSCLVGLTRLADRRARAASR